MNTLTINFGSKTELVAQFVQECLKHQLSFTCGDVTPAPTVVQDPTPAPKPVAKATKPATPKKYNYTEKVIPMIMQDDGTFTLDISKVNKYMARYASKQLHSDEVGCVNTTDYHYYVPQKKDATKVNKSETKKVFDKFGGKITITVEEQEAYYSTWGR